MVKLHAFPSYQPMTLHLACLSVTSSYTSLHPIATQVLHGMKLKLTSALALDKDHH